MKSRRSRQHQCLFVDVKENLMLRRRSRRRQRTRYSNQFLSSLESLLEDSGDLW